MGGDDSTGAGGDATGGGSGSSTGGKGGAGGRGPIGGSGGSDLGGSGGMDTGGMGGDDRDAGRPVDAETPIDAREKSDAAPADGGSKDSASHGDADNAPTDPGKSPFPAGPAPVGAGWTEVQLGKNQVDHPPNQTRYTESNGSWHMWLFNDDLSTFPGRDAGPRSEVHWAYSWTTGQAQFQGDFYIADNCAHASVMQIFGATGHSTAAMFWAMPDSLAYYGRQSVYKPAWDHFFRLNVTYDTGSGVIDVYINGQKTASFMDQGPATHWFKSGIYHQPNMTPRCDVYMQNIHIYKK